MKKMTMGFTLLSAVSGLTAPIVHASIVPTSAPGTFACSPVTNDRFVSGLCVYEVRPYGAQAFAALLRFAQKKAMNFDPNTGSNPQVQHPSDLDGTKMKIAWWFPDAQSNQAMGLALQAADQPTAITQKDSVVITLRMYSFDKRHSRDFGLDLAFFDGKAPEGAQKPQKVSGSLNQGLFKLATGVGNPLASYISFAVQAQVAKKQASVIDEYTFPACEAGSNCSYSHQSNYFISTTAIPAISEKLGIAFSSTPRLDANDPNLVQLQDLSLTYSTATGDEKAPVDVFTPYQWGGLTLRTDQVYVIAGERSSRDVRTGKLLSGETDAGHTRFLVMISVAIQRAGEAAPAQRFEFLPTQAVNYSEEEKAQLNFNDFTFQEILGSLKKVCFTDRVQPDSAEPICGFRFEKMSREYLNHWVRISLKGPMLNTADAERTVRLGDLYKGKGYYRLPMLNPHESSSRYKLTFALDGTSAFAKSLRRSEKIRGVRFIFGYYPGASDPIDLDPQDHPEMLQWLK